jgi:hypothetical protein
MENIANNSTQPDSENNISSLSSFESGLIGYRGLAVGSLSNYIKGGHGSGPDGSNGTLSNYEKRSPDTATAQDDTSTQPDLSSESDEPPLLGI